MTACWRSIRDGQGKVLTVYEFNKTPEAITSTPCVLNFVNPEEQKPVYSEGGPCKFYWTGKSEFHLTQDNKKSNLGNLWQFYRKILIAAANNVTLNGKVIEFALTALTMTGLTYGSEIPHWGIVADWKISENLNGKLIVKSQ
jgi:hypothetical protein